jgi:4-hydroxy-tetrahydrodipicolinate reductase
VRAPGGPRSRTRVAVTGARGNMGALVATTVSEDRELELVALVDPAFAIAKPLGARETLPQGAERFHTLQQALDECAVDVVVDFTLPQAVRANVLTCLDHGVAVVVGTSGLSNGMLQEFAERSAETETPVFVGPNFALGAVLMLRFAQEAAAYLSACEIVELHHESKVDAPSGTARWTATSIEQNWKNRGLEREVPIHSIRLPGLVANQEVIFGGLGETLTIRHDTLGRQAFMPGLLLAIKRVWSLQGLVVGLEKIL